MAELALLIGIAQIVGYLLLLFSIWGVHWTIARLPDRIARAIREDRERQEDIQQWRDRQQTKPSPEDTAKRYPRRRWREDLGRYVDA